MDSVSSSKESQRIEIAFGCDAGYLQPLTVAVVSVLANARNPSRLRFWLITKTLDGLRVIIAGSGRGEWSPAGDPKARVRRRAIGEMPLGEHFTEATYYRLLLPTTFARRTCRG